MGIRLMQFTPRFERWSSLLMALVKVAGGDPLADVPKVPMCIS